MFLVMTVSSSDFDSFGTDVPELDGMGFCIGAMAGATSGATVGAAAACEGALLDQKLGFAALFCDDP